MECHQMEFSPFTSDGTMLLICQWMTLKNGPILVTLSLVDVEIMKQQRLFLVLLVWVFFSLFSLNSFISFFFPLSVPHSNTGQGSQMSYLLSQFIYADPRVYTYGPIEKLLQGNTNQNHIKVSPHSTQSSYYQKEKRACKDVRKRNTYIFYGNISQYSYYGKQHVVTKKKN